MDTLQIALAQIAPVWFDRKRTLAKVCDSISDAASGGADLVVFGEALVPGYPCWIEFSKETAFNSSFHKAFYAEYVNQAVCIERGDLDCVRQLAKEQKIAVYLGIIERPSDRGESVYATLVFINADGEIRSSHRKLMPTYDERMTWAIGDGNGLRTHGLGPFTVGGLNCWENWMPLARTALYAQGEDLHVAVWPGSKRNTNDITRFIALESRSFVASVSGLMRKTDLPSDLPGIDRVIENAPEFLSDGGSCVAGPDGNWIIEPVCNEERVLIATLEHTRVREERQNFDASGHYSRPDIFKLRIDRKRQTTAGFSDE
ncbi:MAG TPA: carbon-nitrogen hydrolase family protein [Pyrinomonadaceae bacterium]|nr:carbon-nitrogen hydrolase family protein [Pyrinomonadaceae bacterium]